METHALNSDGSTTMKELQNRITEKRLGSYVGKEIEVLVEEIIAEEEIALGRGYMNAPEVDGAVILHSGLL